MRYTLICINFFFTIFYSHNINANEVSKWLEKEINVILKAHIKNQNISKEN